MTQEPPIRLSLNYTQDYPCPLCWKGTVRPLALMEAFGCDLCRHIFTADLEEQVLKLADSQIPRRWSWQGNQWRNQDRETLWGLTFAGLAFMVLPTLVISLGVYCFPPLPHSPLSWLPKVWIGLTLLFHTACLVWLAGRYFQLSLGLYWRWLQ